VNPRPAPGRRFEIHSEYYSQVSRKIGVSDYQYLSDFACIHREEFETEGFHLFGILWVDRIRPAGSQRISTVDTVCNALLKMDIFDKDNVLSGCVLSPSIIIPGSVMELVIAYNFFFKING
jgi:hypothetical protein